ncbi:S-adenosyl-L-methionine-dependent methyltransferase [Pavlovales sp. CCMP2436]|nr:S-adenosyl-L-methionine-dependent methyltransferase [Pavlovales sp. CCMP2436]|mmetsp:Transcript_30493/g.76361  ORF Transcript_30493/g.76361 Transcript_30493/m.76361 type:complete len:189 (-) Transcript_30493:5-571(-)
MRAMPKISVLAPEGLWLGSWARFLLGNRLAPFVGTALPVCQAMLRLASVGKTDRLVDLGCGDGRLLILATRDFGAERALGYETDTGLAALARTSAEVEGLASVIEVRQQDACTANLSDCTIVTLYLSTGGNTKLLPVLATLPPSARIVSFHWPIEGFTPIRSLDQSGTKLYLFSAGDFQAGTGSRLDS